MSDVALPRLDWRVVFNQADPPDYKGWGRVRAAQITEMARGVTVAAWGQAFNALLLVVILADRVSLPMLAAWLLALALMMLVAGRHLKRAQARPIPSMPRRAIDRAAYHSLFFGLIWTVPATYFFPAVGHGEQLAICVLTAGMMAGAAFLFSPVPPAAASYVFLMGASATNMLSNSESVAIALIGPIYTAGLLTIVYSSGRAFMQRKCVDLALEERSETVSLLLREYENSDADWLWQTNSSLVFENVSPRFSRAIGHSPEELERMSILDLLDRAAHSEMAGARLAEAVADTINHKAAITDVLVPIAGREGTRCIEISARPRFSSRGRFLGYHGVGSDVTEARQAANRIAHMARHDALTGLPNRLQLLETLDLALAAAREKGGDCAVLLIDLDRFKAINDSLGHVAGDQLLRQVGARFDPILSTGMMIGRLGGDEFALVIPHVSDRASIERLCVEIVDAMKEPFVYNDQHLFVGASIGVALGPSDGANVEELIRNADLALYRAKAEGGDDTCFYQQGLHAQAEERRRIELALRTALERGEFALVYQPVVEARSGRVRSFEALLRWSNPELGAIGPLQFIPIAEETGMINPIGEWVLRKACSDARHLPEDCFVAVNISPIQFMTRDFVGLVGEVVRSTGIQPERLELEVTETAMMQDRDRAALILKQLTEMGISVAVDDFGTGYSNLSYLIDFSFQKLKIDRSFVSRIDSDSTTGAVVSTIVGLSRALGVHTIAEGVETESQATLLKAAGCDVVQGYLFGRPAPLPIGNGQTRDELAAAGDGVRRLH